MGDSRIRLLQEDPQAGLELIMKEYRGLLFQIAQAQLAGSGTREDVEDCVSEAFAQLYEQRERLSEEKGTVKAYLCVLARRRAADMYRKIAGRKENLGESRDSFQQEPPVPGGRRLPFQDGEAEAAVQRHVLLEALKSLGQPDAEIFVRKYYLAQTAREIAAALGMKENTVDQRVARGLRKLRKRLEGGRV